MRAYDTEQRAGSAGCSTVKTMGFFSPGTACVRTRRAVVAAALAATVALIAGAPAAGSAAVQTSLLRGLNIPGVGSYASAQAIDRTVAEAHALHAGAVRVEIPWSMLEPRAQGQVEPRALALTDRLVGDAAADGMGVIATVDSTPCWASSAPAAVLSRCGVHRRTQANAWPPRQPSAYASFVAFLARRYGSRLAAIEVWNEPDQANELYFAGPHKPERYAAILRAAYTAIKQADPGLPVLGGSLVGSNGVFLKRLYAAGIKGYYDGLSVHFYTLTIASLRSIREVQLANGDTAPLWLDEFGWSSCWPKHRVQQEQACVTPAVQAANIANTYRVLSQTSYVAAGVLYKMQDSAGEEFGVIARSGARKPSYAALRSAFASPFGTVSAVTLTLRRQGSQLVASGSGPVGDFMELEAFQGATLRYRALFTLNRFNSYSISLPSVLGTSGLRVRVYRYGAGPARAAQKSY